MKGHRLAVRREEARRRHSPWRRSDALALEEDSPCAMWLRGSRPFPVAVLRQRHQNVAGRAVDVCFATNALGASPGLTCSPSPQKRWSGAGCPKSLQQNAAVGRAPLWSVRSLANHLWASLCAEARGEAWPLKTQLHPLALKAKVRFAAQQAALSAFRKLSTA